MNLWRLIGKECITAAHGHCRRTIGDHGDILPCVSRHFEMFAFYNICRLAVLPLSQWPSSRSRETFSRSILYKKTSQWVCEQFLPVILQIMILYTACLGSSICQITAGQVETQFSLSLTSSLTSTGAQLSQLQGRNNDRQSYSQDFYFFLPKGIFTCRVPDGDVRKFLRGDSDAFWSNIKFSPFSKPGCFSHNDNVFVNIKRIREAVFFNDMGFTVCAVSAFTVSTCA